MKRTVIVGCALGGVLAVALPAAAVTSAGPDATVAAERVWQVGTTRCWNAVLGTVRERGVRVVHWAPDRGHRPGLPAPSGVLGLVGGGGWTEHAVLGTTRSGQQVRYVCRLREEGGRRWYALVHVSVSVR